MTRFGIDAPTALHLARGRITIPDGHQLVAPNSLRSDVLSTLYRDVRSGSLDPDEARAQLDHVTTTRIRLLGDRVSRAVAWRIAEQLGWEDTKLAEYVAVAQLQADVLVTPDDELARQLEGIVPTAPVTVLENL